MCLNDIIEREDIKNIQKQIEEIQEVVFPEEKENIKIDIPDGEIVSKTISDGFGCMTIEYFTMKNGKLVKINPK